MTVPYLNLMRRAAAPARRLWHRSRRLLGLSELSFYQYAFGKAAFRRALRRHGFIPSHVSLHHSHVALRQDIPLLRHIGEFIDRWRVPRGLYREGLLCLGRVLDMIDRRIASHMLLVVATRADAHWDRTDDHPPSAAGATGGTEDADDER